MNTERFFTDQTFELKTKELGRKYRELKDCSPLRERELERSLAQIGQVHPVSVAAEGPNQWQLIDGFKRVHVLEKRNGGETIIRAQALRGGPSTWLSAMLLLNWGQRTVTLLEEGMILQALEQEGLSQTSIAGLLKRDKSWVSRRLAIVKRLESQVLEHLKAGLIHAGTARTLALLPRGNQAVVLEAILEHQLTMRDQEALLRELSQQSEQRLTKGNLERALKKQRETRKPQAGVCKPRDTLAGRLSGMRDACRLVTKAVTEWTEQQSPPSALNGLFEETLEAAEISILALNQFFKGEET